MPKPATAAAALALLLVTAGCSAMPAATPVSAVPAPAATQDAAPPAPPPPPPPVRARIVAVGDTLMHLPLTTTSARGDDWDFTPLFAPIRPYIEGADLAIANLETTLTGASRPWAGYPSFNTPPQFARDLKAVGFDAFTNANNHALDYGEQGLTNTYEALDRYGLAHAGTNRSAADQDRIAVLPAGPQIKVALLAYTYGTNGIPLPHPYSVNLLEAERIRADIRRARALPGVDLVAVALHMGWEYQREPNQEQERYVELALEAGADIILGGHPHVLQRAEMRTVPDQSGEPRRRAVIYSLGNIIGLQYEPYTDDGVILQIDVKKEGGVTTVEQVSYIPTWVHRYWTKDGRRYRVLPAESAVRDCEAKADPLLTAEDCRKVQRSMADTEALMATGPGVQALSVTKP